MKKLLSFLAVFTLMFAVVGCADKEEETTDNAAEETKEENTAELTDQVKSKMYNAARIAEGKVNDTFAHDVAADGETPILTKTFADQAAAVAFLSKYYSEEVATEIYNHYATAETTEAGEIIVKADPFFAETQSLLATTVEDVTVEGDANKGTMTAGAVTYTVELKDGKYIVTGIQK